MAKMDKVEIHVLNDILTNFYAFNKMKPVFAKNELDLTVFKLYLCTIELY